MKRLLFILVALLALPAAAPSTVEEKRHVPGFGEVTIYRPKNMADVRGVVLFVSGDGGWKLGVVDMARILDGRAIVVGLSMPAQSASNRARGSCWPGGRPRDRGPGCGEDLRARALSGRSSSVTRRAPPSFTGARAGASHDLRGCGARLLSRPTKRRFCGPVAAPLGRDKETDGSRDQRLRRTRKERRCRSPFRMTDECAPRQTIAFVEGALMRW
jgi:hypothetical protein